jgi:hypothetical protein
LHPLYQAIQQLAKLTGEHPALRSGAQQHRFASDAPGIYAFSRIDRDGRPFSRVYGQGPDELRSAADRSVTVTVAALSTVVYRSTGPIGTPRAAPQITLNEPTTARQAKDRVHLSADVHGESFCEVTFQAKVGSGQWQSIGTDDNAPFQVYHSISGIDPNTPVQYRAALLDITGRAALSGTRRTRAADPAMVAPADLRTVTIRVNVPPNTGTVYLPGNLDELGPWDPGHHAMQGTGRTRTATLRIPRGTEFEFKFTLGSWETEALGADGQVMSNQTLLVDGDKDVTFDVRAFKRTRNR